MAAGLVTFLCLLVVISLVQALAPIVVMNGIGGTIIYAKLNKPSAKHEWYRIWINVDELAPLVIDCSLDNLEVSYDPESKTYSNAPGVEINATADFGGFGAMMYLDPSEHFIEPYMSTLVQFFTGKGYVVGKDLLGAPYDWRLAADGQGEYLSKLKTLIETAVTTNGIAVTLVAHSMGGLMSLAQTSEWKAKYIKQYVPLDSPWGGAMNALMGIISGYNFGVSVVPHNYFRPLQILTPAMAFLLPVPGDGVDGTFPRSQALIATPSRNYSAFDLEQLMADEGLTVMPDLYARIGPLTSVAQFAAPAVNTYIVYGYSVTTTCGLQYSRDFSSGVVPEAPITEFFACNQDGDGTVNFNSLQRAELAWAKDAGQAKFTLNVTRFPKMEHMNAVSDKRVLALLWSLVQ